MKKAMVGLGLVLLACAKNPVKPLYEKEISLYGFLHGGHPLSVDRAILITWTRPITDVYDLDEAAVQNAEVEIHESETGQRYVLHHTAAQPAFYYNDSLLVQPLHHYQLIIKAEDRVVSAETTVPEMPVLSTYLARDRTNEVVATNLGYNKPIDVYCDNPNQMILVSVFCNEAFSDAEYINPFNDQHKHPESQEEYDGGRNAEPRHIRAYMRYQDLATPAYAGRHVIYWYGSMLVFYGSNTLQVLAIDDNYHRYLYEEHPELNGGVSNGIGLFGSVCGEEYTLQVLKGQ